MQTARTNEGIRYVFEVDSCCCYDTILTWQQVTWADTPKSIPQQDTVITQYARCPACRTEKSVESLPISTDESYKFDYDPTRGVILEFLRQS